MSGHGWIISPTKRSVYVSDVAPLFLGQGSGGMWIWYRQGSSGGSEDICNLEWFAVAVGRDDEGWFDLLWSCPWIIMGQVIPDI